MNFEQQVALNLKQFRLKICNSVFFLKFWYRTHVRDSAENSFSNSTCLLRGGLYYSSCRRLLRHMCVGFSTHGGYLRLLLKILNMDSKLKSSVKISCDYVLVQLTTATLFQSQDLSFLVVWFSRTSQHLPRSILSGRHLLDKSTLMRFEH